jgi:hypothetical protein
MHHINRRKQVPKATTKKVKKARRRWLMPVILATWEAEMKMITV